MEINHKASTTSFAAAVSVRSATRLVSCDVPMNAFSFRL